MSETTPERWLPIVGWEGLYEVSDLGRVRSVDRVTTRLRYGKPLVMRLRGKIRRVRINVRTGYCQITLVRDGTYSAEAVHVLVAEAFLGPRPDGMQVRHMDGNGANPRLSNLQYGTPSENQQDSLRHGTHYSASKTHCPKKHEYTPDNTRIEGGSRVCKTCSNRKSDEYKKQHPEKAREWQRRAQERHRAKKRAGKAAATTNQA